MEKISEMANIGCFEIPPCYINIENNDIGLHPFWDTSTGGFALVVDLRVKRKV